MNISRTQSDVLLTAIYLKSYTHATVSVPDFKTVKKYGGKVFNGMSVIVSHIATAG